VSIRRYVGDVAAPNGSLAIKRTTTFFVVDAIAFVLFALLAATGTLVRYTLPPGSGHFNTVWGMDRHEWGQLHFWMAVGLLAVLALHVFFHWKWVVSMVKGRPREGSGGRFALAVVGVLALVGLIAAPFFAPVEQTGEPGKRRHAAREVIETHEGAETHEDADAHEDGLRIQGSMTLLDVERETGVPVAVLVEGLGLPADVSPDERLGRLRRAHGFEMSDVRTVVAEHQGDE